MYFYIKFFFWFIYNTNWNIHNWNIGVEMVSTISIHSMCAFAICRCYECTKYYMVHKMKIGVEFDYSSAIVALNQTAYRYSNRRRILVIVQFNVLILIWLHCKLFSNYNKVICNRVCNSVDKPRILKTAATAASSSYNVSKLHFFLPFFSRRNWLFS